MSDHNQEIAENEATNEATNNEENVTADVTEERPEGAAAVEETPPGGAEETEEATGAPEEKSELEALAVKVAAVEKERDEYLDQWRRSAAEFQNFKKREERLRLERERNANARLLTNLLPIMDDLQRAAEHVPEEVAGNEWVDGMLAIERKLWATLEQEGVSPIDSAPGTAFDPAVHEALTTEASETVESGHIVNEYQRGYRLNDTILRPARVSVAE